jgi:DNA polymerase alpha subunit B
MADDEILAELAERFGTAGKALEPDVEAELRSIMRLHDLSVEDMFFKWDAYCIKMDSNDLKATPEVLRAFKQSLQDALERSTRTQANIKPEKRVGATPRTVTKNNSDVFGMLDGLTTPSAGRSTKMASARRRQMDTPSISRIKGEPASSPVKLKLEDMGAIP